MPAAAAAADEEPWERDMSFVRASRQRLSIREAFGLQASYLAAYHEALARFLRADPTYRRLPHGTLLLWQEAFLTFPGEFGLPPLPIDEAICRQVVAHGKQMRLELASPPSDWPLAQLPMYLHLK